MSAPTDAQVQAWAAEAVAVLARWGNIAHGAAKRDQLLGDLADGVVFMARQFIARTDAVAPLTKPCHTICAHKGHARPAWETPTIGEAHDS